MIYLLPPLWMTEPSNAETLTFGHGIVIGLVIVLLLLAALGVWVWRENRELRRALEQAMRADFQRIAGDAVRRRIMPEHARIRKAAEKIRECLRKLGG